MELENLSKSINEIKIRRLETLNCKLSQILARERIPASNAIYQIINYVEETPDYLLSHIWPLSPEQNKYNRRKFSNSMNSKNSGCCTII